MRFYEIRTEGGTFWIQAERASDGYAKARAIMTSDPGAVQLRPEYDIAWIDPGKPEFGLDWSAALHALTAPGMDMTTTGADHVLTGARVNGHYDIGDHRILQVSVSPERFLIIPLTPTAEASS